MKQLKVFIPIILLTGLLSGGTKAQSELVFIQRCGTEQKFTGGVNFWSVTGSQTPTVAEVKHDTFTLEPDLTRTVSTFLSSLPLSTAVLYDGAVLMSLVEPPLSGPDAVSDSRFRDLAINTTDSRFASVTIPDTSDGLYWWLLLPETEPGRFGILGWRPLENAFILPVTLTGQNGLTFGEPQTLPFYYNSISSQRYGLSVSSDWRYVAAIQRIPDLNQQEYFIYSIADSRFVWRTTYDGDGIPYVFWMPQDSNSSLVAIVTNTVREQRGILSGVYEDGTEKTLVDLNAVFGGRVDAVYGMGVSRNHIVFLLTSLDQPVHWEGYKLLMFDAETNQIIDFCQPGYISAFLPDKNGSFILFGNLVDNRGDVRLLELATGNYSDIKSGSDYIAPIMGTTLFELEDQDR